MFLFHLVYISEKSPEVMDGYTANMKQMVAVSRRNNVRAAITGMLFSAEEYFLQWLEGSRSHVNDAYNRISRDDRHRRVTLVACGQIAERKFPDWSMSLINVRRTESAMFKAFLPDHHFDPYVMSAETITRFIDTAFDHVRNPHTGLPRNGGLDTHGLSVER